MTMVMRGIARSTATTSSSNNRHMTQRSQSIGKETPVRLTRVIVFCLFVFLSGVSAFSQQDYVARYDAFGSYSFLSTSKLNLFERGFNGQFGVNVRRWLAIGGDFSTFDGHS